MKLFFNKNITFSFLGRIFFIIITIFIASCGGKTPEEELLPPGTVTLSSPTNNNTCFQGSVISGETTSSVTFVWNAADNAESYQIKITNLSTNTSTSHAINGLSYTISLTMNVYYSWNVKAVNANGTTDSENWNFYLSGTPASSYAPAPADLVSPASEAVISSNGASTVDVSFQWIGNDPDNDIESYDVYLDDSNASVKILSAVTDISTTQTLASGKTYYWKVVTKDKAGNSSTAVSSFHIN